MRRAILLAALLFGLGAAEARAEADPYVLYALHCMGCHQRHGEGQASVPQVRDMMGNFLRVPGGRAFLVQVPGVAQSGLGDAETAAVLNWMLDEFSAAQLPPDFRPYDAAEVARYRGGRLLEVETVRARLIEAMRARDLVP